MSDRRKDVESFLDAFASVALVDIAEAAGSTPREAAAWMLVSPDAIFGTIGGGQLEFMAMQRAREMIAQEIASDRLDIPLGPKIGQCCGGRVKIDIALVNGKLREAIGERIEGEDARQAHVYLFGGGHVGRALAASLALLPLHVTMVETRADMLADTPYGVATCLTSLPEEVVRQAPPGSAFIVLTHDHALDFLLVGEALSRDDAAYVGMIGSKTKRETLRRWYLREAKGDDASFARLVCPIGSSSVRDKRPAVIAALVTAEIMASLAQHRTA